MRELVLILCLFAASNAAAQEAPRTQCTDAYAFGLPFGERIAELDVRRALALFPGFLDLLINDGAATRPLHRVTAVARYESGERAEAMMHSLVATLLGSEEFAGRFSDGEIDDESLDNGIIFYSDDSESNQGIALQITKEHTSLLVTCTDLRRRAQALTDGGHR